MESDSEEQLCTVRATPYGGRGVYAQRYIKAGTCVQHCPAPYAYVIARKFRKEVCAWCFKYAFEHGKSTWGWKYEVAKCDSAGLVSESKTVGHQEPGKSTRKGKAASEKSAGISFCSAECRRNWCLDMDVGGLHAALNATVEKLVVQHKDRKAADPPAPQSGGGETDDLTLLRTLQRHWTRTSDVLLSSVSNGTPIISTRQTLSHQEQLDMIWKQAELLYIPSKQHSRHFQPGREEHLTEFEVDTSRFAISALVRYFSEENAAAGGSMTRQVTSDRDRPSGPGVGWSTVLELQNNEVETALQKPAIIAAHLRVYGFVRRVIEITLQAAAASERDWNRLRTYVDESDFVRGLLGRDHGNVFGIWDSADQDDSEMLGWGMYIQGSYFNHDCSPNIKKQRVNRAMNFYATQDIIPGEEMCIAYINVADPVINRRAELNEEWYFDCSCARCQAELIDDANVMKV